MAVGGVLAHQCPQSDHVDVRSGSQQVTVTVEIVRRYVAPTYKKYVRTRRRYQAHDEKNEYRIGDRVEIQEARPLSKRKRWRVRKIIERAQ